MTQSARQERAARNQLLFREVNERIRELNEAFADTLDAPFLVVCECADGACVEQIELTPAAYEDIRGREHHFLVRPGHAQLDVERIVSEAGGYLVVEQPLDGGHAPLRS